MKRDLWRKTFNEFIVTESPKVKFHFGCLLNYFRARWLQGVFDYQKEYRYIDLRSIRFEAYLGIAQNKVREKAEFLEYWKASYLNS